MLSSVNLAVFLLTIIQLIMIRRRIRIASESERRRSAALIRLARGRQIVSVSLPFTAFLIRVISFFFNSLNNKLPSVKLQPLLAIIKV